MHIYDIIVLDIWSSYNRSVAILWEFLLGHVNMFRCLVLNYDSLTLVRLRQRSSSDFYAVFGVTVKLKCVSFAYRNNSKFYQRQLKLSNRNVHDAM